MVIEPIRIANDISMDVVTSIEEHRHELPGVSIDENHCDIIHTKLWLRSCLGM